MEQQESCRTEGGGGLEGLDWSSREATGERVAAGAAEGLQRRGRVLVCSVCTVDSNPDNDAVESNPDIDAGWRLGRPNVGLNLHFDHVDHDTQTTSVHTCQTVTLLQRLAMSE